MRALLLAALGLLLTMSACSAPDHSATRSSSTPASSPVTTPSGEGAADPWAEIPAGAPPRTAYLAGSRYLSPRGPQSLPRGIRTTGAVPFDGGLLVADGIFFEGTNSLALVLDGVRDRRWPGDRHCSSGRPISSPDGDSWHG